LDRFLSQATAVKQLKNKEQWKKEENLRKIMQGVATHPFSWIGHFTPCFGISGKQIQVLYEPAQFFEVLKVTLL